MHKLRKEAEVLRERGYSYTMIEEKLGISRSTMSYWFKDKPFTPNKRALGRMKNGPAKVGINRHNRRVAEIVTLKKQGAREVGTLSARDLFMLGLGLYIGEGAKTTEAIRIVNSDPEVIRLAVHWLKEACGLADDNLTVSLHLYPDNDIAACRKYWQDVTGLSLQNFRWISIDRRENKERSNRGKLPFGTAHITVRANGDPEKGVRLFRRLSGWMSGALNQV